MIKNIMGFASTDVFNDTLFPGSPPPPSSIAFTVLRMREHLGKLHICVRAQYVDIQYSNLQNTAQAINF